WDRITLMSAHLVNSLGWWHGSAVLVGFVLMFSIATFAVSADQDDNDNVPVFLVTNVQVNWCDSRHDGSDRAGTLKPPTMIFGVDTLQSTRDYDYSRHVSGRTVLDISSSLRC